ncbi:hypothetical protein DVH05_015292 [Phytophthora capsici]|nr:hypothetical protein DVH05_015292 [Phytophthora capsici]
MSRMMMKFMRDMGASGIGVDSPSNSFHYATSNDEYKGDDEGEAEDEDKYELDNNFEYIPVNESKDEESNDLKDNKETNGTELKKNEEENGLEDKKKKDVAEKKGTADRDQQSATESTPLRNDTPNAVVATTFSSPAPSEKMPVAPTQTPKKRKIPAAMLGSGGSTVTQTTPLRRSSRKKHKTSRYTYSIEEEEPVKTERPDKQIADNQVMAHFTRLTPKMVCKHCNEELLVSRGVAKKHLESCSGVKFSSRK